MDKLSADLKEGENFFIVDLSSVSFYSQEGLNIIANDEIKYKNIPFLYLVFSYLRNGSIDWAINNLKYINKKNAGDWVIYQFRK